MLALTSHIGTGFQIKLKTFKEKILSKHISKMPTKISYVEKRIYRAMLKGGIHFMISTFLFRARQPNNMKSKIPAKGKSDYNPEFEF